MKHFINLAILLLPLFTDALTAQDSLFWQRYDDFFNTLGETVNTAEEALAFIAPFLSERRRTGPTDADLAYRYHQVALYPGFFGAANALRYADTAIVLRTEARVGKPDIAQSIYQRGRVLRDMARHRSALRDFEVAVGMMREAYAAAETPEVRRNLARRLGYFYREAANAARENGDFGLADLFLDQIPPLLAVGPNPRTEFDALLTRADVHNDAGRYGQAISLYTSFFNSPDYVQAKSLDQAVILQNLGTALNRDGQPGAARIRLEQSAALHRAANRSRLLSFVQSELVSVHNKLGDVIAADESFAAGLTNAERAFPSGKAAVFGEVFAHGAETKALRDDFPAAQALLRRGFEGVIENPVFAGPAGLPVLTDALIYSKEELLTALTVKRTAHLRAYERGVEDQGLEFALFTARTIDTLFRRSRSELSLTASLADLFRLENEEYETAVDLALRLYRERGDERYLTEAYHFATGRKSQLLRKYLISPRLAEDFGVGPELIERKTDIEWRIALTENGLQTAADTAKQGLRATLLELRDQEEAVRRQLETDHPAYVRAVRGLPETDPVAAAATLETNRVVADFFLGTDSIYLFTLARAGGLAVRVLPRPAGLGTSVAAVLTDTAAAADLYDQLVAPVLANRPEVERIQFIPDGLLWRVPFGTLRHKGRYLIEDVAVSYAYAAGLLFDRAAYVPTANDRNDYLGFGISYKDVLLSISPADTRSPVANEVRSMGRLPWADREVSTAAEIMNGTSRLEAAATKQRFLSEGGRGGIVHLSMHGLLRPNPMESALVFRGETDRIDLLTMAEVLTGGYPNALTVLSACHTGGGPVRTTEGMQSIGRAFTAAGSRATITSTWAARDDATHDILVAFYRHLHDGAPKDVALQQAVVAFLSSGTPTDRLPANWGNLVVTGEVDGIRTGPGWWWYLAGGLALLAVLLYFVLRRRGTEEGW